MATSVLSQLSSPTPELPNPSSVLLKSSFISDSKLFFAPNSITKKFGQKRLYKPRSASFNHIPKQFRQENLKDGFLQPSPSLLAQFCIPYFMSKRPAAAVLRSISKEEPLLEGMPKEYYDDEWQAQQREQSKELERLRKIEDDEEEMKIEEYREIGLRLSEYPDEDVRNARKLVSSFIRSAEEVEEKIEEAAAKGELNELVLMVIWNRLDLARRDDEKDAVRSLDLLYRRVETEILKQEATPSMRLLNDLLNMHDGFEDDGWLKECKKCMIDTFPREDPFSILVPAGFDIHKHQGPLQPPLDSDDIILRVDFVREVDALLREVKEEESEGQNVEGFDAESVATKLKQQEKQRTIRKVEALLDLAINLKI